MILTSANLKKNENTFSKVKFAKMNIFLRKFQNENIEKCSLMFYETRKIVLF